ncbi:MAG: crotonase/enoyl-CoA hydratase family protein [Burkholderiales bacterium]
MNAVVEFPTLANPAALTQAAVDYDVETSTMYWWMRPAPRPCFNELLLKESTAFEGQIEQHSGWFLYDGKERPIRNAVFGSAVPGVFNLGGDLAMFVQAILRKDRNTLRAYGHSCVDNMYRRMVGYNADVMTYSLVQGKAFGGGFECALASEMIVAEEAATFSFPEVLFNMFPGMGALSLLARKIGMRGAEEVIMSGKVYTADEMMKMGVVDEIAADGAGLEAVRYLIKSRQRKQNSYRAMSLAKREIHPVSHAEMRNVVEIWVDAALALENRDLRMMARLARAQDKMTIGLGDAEQIASGVDFEFAEAANS